MLKGILKLNGVHRLKKSAQMEVNAGRGGCNTRCDFEGQLCFHSCCQGLCAGHPNTGFTCIPI